jgi:hypothetical protein
VENVTARCVVAIHVHCLPSTSAAADPRAPVASCIHRRQSLRVSTEPRTARSRSGRLRNRRSSRWVSTPSNAKNRKPASQRTASPTVLPFASTTVALPVIPDHATAKGRTRSATAPAVPAATIMRISSCLSPPTSRSLGNTVLIQG